MARPPVVPMRSFDATAQEGVDPPKHSESRGAMVIRMYNRLHAIWGRHRGFPQNLWRAGHNATEMRSPKSSQARQSIASHRQPDPAESLGIRRTAL